MSATEALALLAAMTALAALPSASVALVVSRSVAAGLSHGIAAALGIVLGDLIFVAAALIGLAALAEALGGLFALIKLIGGLYLIWLGCSMLVSRAKDSGGSVMPASSSGLRSSLLAGLLVTLGDVKAVMFYASLFPLFVEIDMLDVADVLLVVTITALAVGGMKLLYALVAHQLAAMARNTRAGRFAQRSAGAMLLGAGSYLIATAPR
jgi:threonine/homoserine/homoserine lactone efflux protein